jgi:hypothetical protein
MLEHSPKLLPLHRKLPERPVAVEKVLEHPAVVLVVENAVRVEFGDMSPPAGTRSPGSLACSCCAVARTASRRSVLGQDALPGHDTLMISLNRLVWQALMRRSANIYRSQTRYRGPVYVLIENDNGLALEPLQRTPANAYCAVTALAAILAAAIRVSTPSLINRFWLCFLIVFAEAFRMMAISGLVLPSQIQ